jgi:hypothetical protein
VELGTPLDSLAVGKVANSQTEDWAGASEDSLEETVGSRTEESVDSSQQILAEFPFEVVGENTGVDRLVGEDPYTCQVG